MSKSNVSNGEIQAEVDPIDNNNEWKVSVLYVDSTMQLKCC